jgi:asparagine synthase (glutamine-hydrolysing)
VSGICGIVNFNGEQVVPELLQRMAEATAFNHRDGIRYWVDSHIGMAYLSSQTTLESVGEKQPLVKYQGDLVLVADVRIDNRPELVRILTEKGCIKTHQPTDADLVLAAYQAWKDQSPCHLLGDFAFVIWDNYQKTIFAARDQKGWRSLHYYYDHRKFLWATEAVQILAHPGISFHLNEYTIAQDLARPGIGGQKESYFESIMKLGSAEKMVVNVDNLQTKKYWEIDTHKEIHYKTEEEYVEHFFNIFRDAVSSRLRCNGPIILFQSGGLDSTAIAATAAQIVNDSSDIDFHTVTFTSKKFPLTEEIDRSRAVSQMWNITHHEICVDHFSLFYTPPFSRLHPDEPYDTPWHSFYAGALKNLDFAPHVWLTGMEGDIVVGVGSPFYYFDLLRAGRIGQFVRVFMRDCTELGVSPWWLIRRYLIRPYILDAFRQVLWPVYHDVLGKNQSQQPWISSSLVKRTNLRQWIQDQEFPGLHFLNLDRRTRISRDSNKDWRYRLHQDPRSVRQRVWYQNMAKFFGAEFRDPWSDIRLTDFSLSVPQDILSPGTNRKLLIRKTFSNKLPGSVLNHLGLKTGPEAWVREKIREFETRDKISQLFSSSQAARLGYIVPHELINAYENVRQDSYKFSLPMWIAYCLENWLNMYYNFL